MFRRRRGVLVEVAERVLRNIFEQRSLQPEGRFSEERFGKEEDLRPEIGRDPVDVEQVVRQHDHDSSGLDRMVGQIDRKIGLPADAQYIDTEPQTIGPLYKIGQRGFSLHELLPVQKLLPLLRIHFSHHFRQR